jgi:hypothetical protein
MFVQEDPAQAQTKGTSSVTNTAAAAALAAWYSELYMLISIFTLKIVCWHLSIYPPLSRCFHLYQTMLLDFARYIHFGLFLDL